MKQNPGIWLIYISTMDACPLLKYDYVQVKQANTHIKITSIFFLEINYKHFIIPNYKYFYGKNAEYTPQVNNTGKV